MLCDKIYLIRPNNLLHIDPGGLLTRFKADFKKKKKKSTLLLSFLLMVLTEFCVLCSEGEIFLEPSPYILKIL